MKKTGKTLESLFPGKIGKLQMTRVMLRHMDLCIDKLALDESIPDDTLEAIRAAIAEDKAR